MICMYVCMYTYEGDAVNYDGELSSSKLILCVNPCKVVNNT